MSVPDNAIFEGPNVYAIGEQPCGLKRYTYMSVEHDWSPPPLNRCPDCRREIIAWAVYRGHVCKCGWSCGGKCVHISRLGSHEERK